MNDAKENASDYEYKALISKTLYLCAQYSIEQGEFVTKTINRVKEHALEAIQKYVEHWFSINKSIELDINFKLLWSHDLMYVDCQNLMTLLTTNEVKRKNELIRFLTSLTNFITNFLPQL